ncbi:antibiotic biosynthesis monooxygenase [Pseudomonas chlororaphis]|uniref:antibiotic biosynthesis monooxygenase family protein n=1 Tax=Pseudomonas chlororaphis TaxID=587753 RepID=UPI00209BA332|nr:antibiotic biosynthesis monooxygenase [Pseudomonas chlororaphis]MCO7571241.1 antibiotic biosynthesis monooxygenase [Pseudomonas chlororaphis]MCO7589559.1 antibiotic biosynthesis monooxygenase [Pseudomonas chlororaphis]
MIGQTPAPPYYAVIFSSQRGAADLDYDQAAERMLQLARRQPGFLGVESARGADGFGITVSYWSSEAAILAWKHHAEHSAIRERGRNDWYQYAHTRVGKVERAYAVHPQAQARTAVHSGPGLPPDQS